MHLRRAVLLFAIVLLLSAVAASISPRSRQAQPPAGTTEQTAQTPPGEPPPLQAVAMRVPARHGRPAVRVTREGHVAVYVTSATPGQVTIGKLGLTQAAEPGTPATFDLFATSRGRYPVVFSAADGSGPTAVGTIVIRG
jgi:hypothetical protein